jgi:hypothetical protein
MIITIVMFMMLVNTLCDQMSSLFFSQLQGMIGGDMQLSIGYSDSYKQDNKNAMTKSNH